tara:strand:+ start:19968 stop:20909 length:942 start_codon:yes stop_codon:yes gene_type:complete
MNNKTINILGGDYEFTLDISGKCEDYKFKYHPSHLQEIYKKILNHQIFEVSEFSLSNYAMMRDRSICDMVAIPIFINRGFRHGIMWVRSDSKISNPSELKNAKVGIKDYSQTAAVWLRGILFDEYKVHWSEIKWFANKLQRFEAPASVDISLIDEDPEELLISGELDVYVAPRPQDLKRPINNRKLKPMLNNVIEIEKNYFNRSGIYPINHCVVIHKQTYSKHPNIGHALFNAYTKSKQRALERKLGSTFLPWAESNWRETMQLFNNDPYPYGLNQSNRKNVGKLINYLSEQELIDQKPNIEDLFINESLHWE